MQLDPATSIACLLIASLVALPALQAARRRRSSRECSEVAVGLNEFANAVRRAQRCLPLEDPLLTRVRRLPIPEVITFEFAQHLPLPEPSLLADAAHRLALRLKRRVAFERKMLARTASGRRRGAIAAAVPGAVLLCLQLAGVTMPLPALALLLAAELLGGWLLWRVARVEI